VVWMIAFGNRYFYTGSGVKPGMTKKGSGVVFVGPLYSVGILHAKAVGKMPTIRIKVSGGSFLVILGVFFVDIFCCFC